MRRCSSKATTINIGACYERLKEYELAIQNYSKEGEIDPDDSDVPFRLARVYLKTNRYQEALKTIDAAIAMKNDRSESHFYRGLALQGLGALSEAKSAFQTALKIDSKNKDARLALDRMDAPVR